MVYPRSVSESLPPSAPRLKRWAIPAVLFLGLFLLYQANGSFLRVGDAVPNLYLPVQILSRGSLTFSPEEAPFMFTWEDRVHLPGKRLTVRSWDDRVMGHVARDLHRSGAFVLVAPKYYLVRAVQPGRYVGIYGPGAGVSALPFFALVALVRPDWRENSAVLGAEGKLFASMAIAGSAVLVFLSLLRFLPCRPSLALTVLYGTGTCVWAEPSQTLWQQSPAIFFVALGVYLFLRVGDGRGFAAGSGAALGLAAACRPSLALLLGCVGLYVLLRERKAVLPMILGAALPIVLLLMFNAHYLGSPLRFGQVAAAEALSKDPTASAPAWQGSWGVGLAGILISPSRSLFVFSPFLLFAVWGGVRCWRSAEHSRLRPLVVAILLIIALAALWFQWWGGWSFGYRIVAEATPLFMLLLVPVADRGSDRRILAAFGFLAFVSVAIQALGAFGYETGSWNNQSGYRILVNGAEEITTQDQALRRVQTGEAAYLGTTEMDVSRPEFRHRLWSIRKGQIAWLLQPYAVIEGLASRRSIVLDAAFERAGRPDEP